VSVSRFPKETGRSLVCALVLVSLLAGAGCGTTAAARTPSEVLAEAVDNLLALDTYRYGGTSEMTVGGDSRLDSMARFETVLVSADNGALDGHMTVSSPGYSYDTYSYKGYEYTLVKGSGWTRLDRGSGDPGYGMVSAGARDIIRHFANLVEDVKLVGETAEDYTVSMKMGSRYQAGAAAIAGGGAQVSAPSSPGERDTRMVIVVSKKGMRMKSVYMSDERAPSGSAPAVRIVTKGTYSGFNEPADIKPPAEALSAPETGAQAAPPTQQPQ
jgi:hypothetical protein